MSLKTEIDKIFDNYTNYQNPNQVLTLTNSLKRLSSDLYTDSKRFVYELLQNADDSSVNTSPVKVWIKIIDNHLIVAHSGTPFSERDLQGICDVDNGTKKKDLSKTGYKGIGFKSVFGHSNKVIIYTDSEYFRFDSSFEHEWKWDGTQEEWEKTKERKFEYSWQLIPILTVTSEVNNEINQYIKDVGANVATIITIKKIDQIKQSILELSDKLNMFLFLKNISELNIDVNDLTQIEIKNINNQVTLYKNQELDSRWILKTLDLPIPDTVKTSLKDEQNPPEKLLEANEIELTLATKVDSEKRVIELLPQERLLYSYLPTDETKYNFPILVNTSFLTTSNRENLHVNSKWNQWLFKSISIELFTWIAHLVTTEVGYDAYKLIPNESSFGDLGTKFNEGIREALESIPFIVSKENKLLRIKDTIIDFTFLSEKDFIGESVIKNYLNESKKHFAQNTGFGGKFKKLGASSFDWNNFPSFLDSTSFNQHLTATKNILLIKHLKTISESKKTKEIDVDFLKKISFIKDHKNNVKSPGQVCFPSADDLNWNNPDSELSFLHGEILNWLNSDIEYRDWLENLGVVERTDITYVTQTIIPNIDTYITFDNAIEAIQELFRWYRKGELTELLIRELSSIKLLTQKKSLRPAKDCFFSEYYAPHLRIENIVEEDFFISESYCLQNIDKEEWKRFFKFLGVKENIEILEFSQKTPNAELMHQGFNERYFSENDKKHTFWNTYTAYAYQNISTFELLNHTIKNSKFSTVFWQNILDYELSDLITSSAISFWGNAGMAGAITGDRVQNYIPWYIRHIECIPTTLDDSCETALNTFLNTEEIRILADNYLPVFNGPDLSPDWRAFFDFKTELKLADYLQILSRISLDIDEDGKIKKKNLKRVQSVYNQLLKRCSNWSDDDITMINDWSKKGLLLNTKNEFSNSNTLKFFLDGNESIFQGQFDFIYLNPENRSHANIETLLSYFQVDILRQSDFNLEYTNISKSVNLYDSLHRIIPYFKLWILSEISDDETAELLDKMSSLIENLTINEAIELRIKYDEIQFSKNVNVHFDSNELYVTTPWDANNVLLQLPEVLCRYLNFKGHDKKLDFLLRSRTSEIIEYFTQENITIPAELINSSSELNNEIDDEILAKNPSSTFSPKIDSFSEIIDAVDNKGSKLEFYHISRHDYEKLKYVQDLIPRAVENVLTYLKNRPEYDCTQFYQIAPSIIGGVTKNGNAITIVARPSDHDYILLYYASEFNVLEYTDAELWYEDGVNTPKQLTFGYLLNLARINKIPVNNSIIDISHLNDLSNKAKSQEFDFFPLPPSPEKIAQIIASFANTDGGELVFGLKELDNSTNSIVGLGSEVRVDEIFNKAMLSLSPTPDVVSDRVIIQDKNVYIIKVEKSTKDILLEDEKYIRNNLVSASNKRIEIKQTIINNPLIAKNIAIIIGIEKYLVRKENQITDVKYAENDVIKFKETLIKKLHISEEDIDIFINEDAVKSNLQYELTKLFDALTENDRLIFYYAGHGFHNGVTNYLSTYDMHKSNIVDTSISLKDILLDPLAESKCANALIFIDACAQSIKDKDGRNQLFDIDQEELIVLNKKFPNYSIFLSCQIGQSSYSSDKLENGIWTYHLVDALNGNVEEVIRGDANKKYVTDKLLSEYLTKQVSKFANEEEHKNQTPRYILDSSYENVIIEI